MRPAAALVYLASVARVAAIQYGFPSVKSETSSFIDVNPVSVADGRGWEAGPQPPSQATSPGSARRSDRTPFVDYVVE